MDPIQSGAVTIADLYRELIGMRGDLANALSRVQVIDERDRISEAARADHETRLRLLERFRYTLGGLALVGGAAASLIVQYLGQHLH